VRHSLSYGGIPAEPKFKQPRPSKPELMVVADISGSVAAFARFTLMLVYAMQNQFSKVRSFVFIDGIDEVTEYFKGTEDIGEAIHRVNTEADVVWVDGHSDYGHAFEVFWERYGKSIGPKTTVLFLGDARNNYHASQAWVVQEVRKKARQVFQAQMCPWRRAVEAKFGAACGQIRQAVLVHGWYSARPAGLTRIAVFVAIRGNLLCGRIIGESWRALRVFKRIMRDMEWIWDIVCVALSMPIL
jgi:uncharacterized protein with von Willebrand factor type A (vWA) domain